MGFRTGSEAGASTLPGNHPFSQALHGSSRCLSPIQSAGEMCGLQGLPLLGARYRGCPILS